MEQLRDNQENENVKYLIPYLKNTKKKSILAPLFKMLEACFDLIVPLIVADLIDVGIASRDTHYILTHFGLLLVMALLGLTCSFTAQYFAAKSSNQEHPQDYGMNCWTRSRVSASRNLIRQERQH